MTLPPADGGWGAGECGGSAERARWLQVEIRCITDRISSMLENNNNHRKEVITNQE